jgi:hypothetical protein
MQANQTKHNIGKMSFNVSIIKDEYHQTNQFLE